MASPQPPGDAVHTVPYLRTLPLRTKAPVKARSQRPSDPLLALAQGVSGHSIPVFLLMLPADLAN